MKFTTNTMKKRLIATAAIALMGSGCAIQQSGNIKTSGLQVQYSISGNSASYAAATAQFTEAGEVGIGTTYVQLSDGDTVSVNGLPLAETDSLTVDYGVIVPYQVGGTYTFTFTRQGETPYVSTVTLPDAVNITSPAALATLPRGQAFALNWTPGATATDEVTAFMSTNGNPASNSFSQMLMPDTGTVTIGAIYTATAPTGTQFPSPVPPTEASINVSRQRQGTMPTGLAGTVSATQSQNVGINLN